MDLRLFEAAQTAETFGKFSHHSRDKKGDVPKERIGTGATAHLLLLTLWRLLLGRGRADLFIGLLHAGLKADASLFSGAVHERNMAVTLAFAVVFAWGCVTAALPLAVVLTAAGNVLGDHDPVPLGRTHEAYACATGTAF